MPLSVFTVYHYAQSNQNEDIKSTLYDTQIACPPSPFINNMIADHQFYYVFNLIWEQAILVYRCAIHHTTIWEVSH